MYVFTYSADIYNVPGTVLGTRDIAVNKKQTPIPVLMDFSF